VICSHKAFQKIKTCELDFFTIFYYFSAAKYEKPCMVPAF
jgi:hypothetical protein